MMQERLTSLTSPPLTVDRDKARCDGQGRMGAVVEQVNAAMGRQGGEMMTAVVR